MASVEIKRVETRADLKAFVELHYDLYEGNEDDAPNLFSDDIARLSISWLTRRERWWVV